MVEGAALEMLCSQKEPRVRIPNSPPKSPVNKRFSGLFFFALLLKIGTKLWEEQLDFWKEQGDFRHFGVFDP